MTDRISHTSKSGKALCLHYRNGNRCRRVAHHVVEFRDSQGHHWMSVCDECKETVLQNDPEAQVLESDRKGFGVKVETTPTGGTKRHYTALGEELHEAGFFPEKEDEVAKVENEQRPDFLTEDMLRFLDRAKNSGVVDMKTVRPQFQAAFEEYELGRIHCNRVVRYWKKTYGERFEAGEVDPAEAEFELPDPEASDYLMWVGGKYYPTADVFIEEVEKQGVAKRVGSLPNRLIPGISRVFLAHDDGIVGDGFIFGYFTVSQIQLLWERPEDIPESLAAHVTPVHISELASEDSRECGDRDTPGAVYAVSFEGAAPKQAKIDHFKELEPPRVADRFVELAEGKGGRFRGMKELEPGDGDIIIGVTTDESAADYDSADFMEMPSRISKKRLAGKTAPYGWVDAQDEHLMKVYRNRAPKGYSAASIAQFYAYMTGRSKASVYNRLMKLFKEESED